MYGLILLLCYKEKKGKLHLSIYSRYPSKQSEGYTRGTNKSGCVYVFSAIHYNRI